MTVQTITRRFKKDRTHVMFSPELQGALDELVGNQHKSSFVERATWALLLEEYDEAEILAAVQQVHDESDAPQLTEPKEYELPA